MTPTVRLAVKHLPRVEGGGPALVVGAPGGEEVAAIDALLGGATRFFFADHADWRAARPVVGERAVAAAWLDEPERYARVLLFLPKGRRRQEMFIAECARALRGDGELWLVGHNDEGAKTAPTLLERQFSRIVRQEHGSHCRLVHAVGPRRGEPGAAEPGLDAWWSETTVELAGGALRVAALPGVFSEGRLDAGTAFLLAHWRLPAGAALLDVGCGSGVLGALALRAGVASALMVDTDYLAVESARRTTAALAGARVAASDVYSDVSGRFDVIVSNPPFHRGVRTDYDIAARIIDEAPDRLTPRGELWIVANSFLPYPERIQRRFGSCEVVAKNKQFAVYRARR